MRFYTSWNDFTRLGLNFHDFIGDFFKFISDYLDKHWESVKIIKIYYGLQQILKLI